MEDPHDQVVPLGPVPVRDRDRGRGRSGGDAPAAALAIELTDDLSRLPAALVAGIRQSRGMENLEAVLADVGRLERELRGLERALIGAGDGITSDCTNGTAIPDELVPRLNELVRAATAAGATTKADLGAELEALRTRVESQPNERLKRAARDVQASFERFLVRHDTAWVAASSALAGIQDATATLQTEAQACRMQAEPFLTFGRAAEAPAPTQAPPRSAAAVYLAVAWGDRVLAPATYAAQMRKEFPALSAALAAAGSACEREASCHYMAASSVGDSNRCLAVLEAGAGANRRIVGTIDRPGVQRELAAFCTGVRPATDCRIADLHCLP